MMNSVATIFPIDIHTTLPKILVITVILLPSWAQEKIDTYAECWTFGHCSKQNLKTIPHNVTALRTLGSLLLNQNSIEELASIPEMTRLCHLDLSRNRLRKFPWSSLRSTPNITTLKLNNNEISEVDAYVDFPQSLRWLYLQSNRIATIPETFLSGLKQPALFLCISRNPFLCDCKIQWIARLRRCLWEHRHEGCVDANSDKVKRCVLANCNFHPNSVLVIMDRFLMNGVPFIKQLSPGQLLKCDAPQELKGRLLRDVTSTTSLCNANSAVHGFSDPSPQIGGRQDVGRPATVNQAASTTCTSPTTPESLQLVSSPTSSQGRTAKLDTAENRMATIIDQCVRSFVISFWKELLTAFLGAVLVITAVAIIGLRVKSLVCSAYRRLAGSSDAPHKKEGPTSSASRRHEDVAADNDYTETIVSPLSNLSSDEDIPPPLPPRRGILAVTVFSLWLDLVSLPLVSPRVGGSHCLNVGDFIRPRPNFRISCSRLSWSEEDPFGDLAFKACEQAADRRGGSDSRRLTLHHTLYGPALLTDFILL
ncbi:hypothetical protein Bbelb_142340 [Branchiostoma belcheri]|nr:hypothetical protein Bbelb_142340 [Branchiostoma belcheri]